ncbi:PolC-type DNA polymerase III [Dethiothermospora halolimnae]|uniref:PolC-type DNA polymerase III n=1 Tax=Dethiothermospora halolimnae TaxID=3114390 RepID=UPI003CCBDAAE
MTNNKKILGQLLKRIDIDIDNKRLGNAIIDKVYVNNKKYQLKIIIILDNIIEKELIDKLTEELKIKLGDFKNIEIKVKYSIEDLNLEKIMKVYWENILYIIKRDIPSSSAWINSIDYKVKDNSFEINILNETGFLWLKNKKVDNLISNILKEEFNFDIPVSLTCNGDNSELHDIHEKKKKEEEKIFSSTISKAIGSTNKNKKNTKNTNTVSSNIILGKGIKEMPVDICEIDTNTGTATIEGEIFDLEVRDIKGNRKIYSFNITDYTSSMTVKIFANKKVQPILDESLREGLYLKVKGDIVFDKFMKELIMISKSMVKMEKEEKTDNSKEKRVELHLHTQMSDMDGMTNVSKVIERASKWGHKAIAITDHGVVQAFPEAMEASRKNGIKVLYGLEGYVVNDSKPVVVNFRNEPIDCEYVVFDIETTGLSPKHDEITEIGAVKIKNNKIVDKYSQLINPERKIPEKIVKLTGITDEMVKDKPTINEVLPEFHNFIGDSVLVAHNASFDMGFINEKFSKLDIILSNPVLDTLQLSRQLFTELKSHRLNKVAKHLNVSLENHHRAVDDSEATANILLKSLELIKEKGVNKLEDINTIFSGNVNYKSADSYHIMIFAKNYTGLKNLYKIVSEAHLNYFYRKPRIPKSVLNKYREGLILGTACEAGELFRAILRNKSYNEIREIVDFYDFLEIQPIGNNNFLIEKEILKSPEDIKNINKKIVNLGEKFHKPVVATGDVHFLDPEDEVYRRILMSGKGFSDADNQPPLYFRTTNEMLEEFIYLGRDKAREVVIENTNLIADMIDEILPIPDGTFPPVIEGSEEELRTITYNKAISIYGDPLPDIVKNRLERELNSIISNGYAVLYIISQKLVKKSLEDGYLVGSRGSVGSSFVATMSDITEVNPLPPHYVCPDCKHSEFITDGSVGSGADMKEKDCPKCGSRYIKDGHDIPFEVFLGFEGDKEPDIDLNFAGEEQSVAHKYTELLFGEGHVFRAGTIGTIADKTAYGFVKKYFDEKETVLSKAETSRLLRGCTGVKRTSGQHPGGVMVVPRSKDVYDFTPVQYPANDKSSGVITTHFDYHSISGRILKLDILGHDTPSIIRMLEDLTGIDAQNIPLDDEDTMKIFTSTETLGITEEDINSKVGSFGIPEFGTKFVRQMLIDTQPSTFAELVRISGLSHGTDVWLNNAQDLVRNGVTTLSQVISTRDDIMMYLIYNGLDKKRSFTMMEKVRKGKGLTEEEESYMRENGIPEWYIESCKKIKYMFPKAHAVAYVMMSFRIAYFKVHYPEAFYATYFTTKAVDFDAQLIVKGEEAIRSKIKELEALGNDKTAKEKNLLTVLEVALEMYCRGLRFNKVDLYKSHSDIFIIDDNGITPPLKSLQGVGENAARSIFTERENGKFISIEDMTNRCKITKTVVEALTIHGCLEGLSERNQLSLFGI